MVTDEQPSPRLTDNVKQQRPSRAPSWASLRRFPGSVSFAEISQIAQHEAVLICDPQENPLVLMPTAAYDHLTRYVDQSLSKVDGREKAHVSELSNSDVAFQDEAEYWTALKQIDHLAAQAQEWERTHGSDAGTLGAAFAKACEVFEHVVPAIDWLSRPNALLGGAKPSRLIATDAGAQRVLNALSKIEYGIPV